MRAREYSLDGSHKHHVAPWYRDAVFYGVDLARFRDSDGNGYGDLKGLTQSLEYLEWLGVDAIWLQPFYRSPRQDNGYDVVDHFEIDPRLGTTGDFVALLREAEDRDIQVLIDLVISHTSSEHRWFEESRKPGSPKRDWYVWTDDVSTVPDYPVIFPPDQTSTWTRDDVSGAWYLHHFHDFEPDLNTSNEEVRAEIRNMVEYWIRLGVRGFRVDGAPFFGQKQEQDENAVHEMLHGIHVWAQEIEEHTVLLPEADLDAPELVPYAANGDAQMLFNFLGSQYIFLAMATGRAEPLQRSLDLLPPGSGYFQWLNFLRSHDELTLERLDEDEQQTVLDAFAPDPDMHIYNRGTRRRLAPMLNGDRRQMQLAFSLMFSLPGSPMFIAGDEIGMGENLDLPERNAARLPVQWSADRPNGGFSDADPDDLVAPVLTEGPFSIDHVNIESQRDNEDSFLYWIRLLIATRKRAFAGMGPADTRVEIPAPSVFALIHAGEHDRTVVTIHNLASEPVTLSTDGGHTITLLLNEGTTLASDETSLDLAPHGFAWWTQDGVPQFSGAPAPAQYESEIVT